MFWAPCGLSQGPQALTYDAAQDTLVLAYRLAAATRTGGPVEDDPDVAPASRLESLPAPALLSHLGLQSGRVSS